MKRTFAALLSAIMLLSVVLIPVPVSASAAQIPANSVYVDQTANGADGTTVEFENGGVKYSAVIGTTAFKSLSEALQKVEAGGTVYLAPGTYSEGVTITKDVNILGPKAGINPNVKGAAAADAWTRNSSRGKDEAILTTSWHLGINAPSNAVYECHNITIDGIAISGAGMLRSNYGAAGSCNITVRNILVQGYTTSGNGPFFFLPYYPDKTKNDYIRSVVAENIRFEGQTTAPGFFLTVDSFRGSGIFFDRTSSKPVTNYVTVCGSENNASIEFSDCMFLQDSSQVLNLDLSKNAGGYPFNSAIDKKQSVKVSVKNCVVRGDAALAGENLSNIIVTKADSDKVVFDISGNTLAEDKPAIPAVVDATHYDLGKEVRFFGRTYEKSGVHYFNWCASGFTFRFEGTGASATIVSNCPDSGNTAFLKIYVDGEEQPDVALTKKEQTITLCSGLASGAHEVTVRKRTNSRSSTAGVSAIELDAGGKKLSPSEAKSRYIEFIGDSLTVGYASVAGNASAWSTSTEDVTRTYAPAVAAALDAEYGVIAVSGRGIGRNYGGDTDKLMPELYQYTDEYNLPGVKWDYGAIKPDVLVVNMGTNDASSLSVQYQKEDFQAAYKAFIKQLRGYYPETKILCVYCLTDTTLHRSIMNAVDELKAEGDGGVEYLKLKPVGNDAALGHPTEAGYAKNADAVIEAVKNIAGWGDPGTGNTESSGNTDNTDNTEIAENTHNTTDTPDVSGTPKDETTADAGEGKKGCGSASAAVIVPVMLLASVMFAKKKEN